MSGIKIDYAAADSITVSNLKDHLEILEDYVKSPDIHSIDYQEYQSTLIPAIKTVLKYFGE